MSSSAAAQQAQGGGGVKVVAGRGRSVTVGSGGQVTIPEEQLTVGVIKGRVTPVMAGEHRRSERVVLDVVQ